VTPISSPRFSKQKTYSTPGRRDSSTVRSTHTAAMVRSRRCGSRQHEASWSLV
jgi:hypothetical protein